MTDELLYNVDTGIIVLVLFVILIVALEIGYWLGRRVRSNTDDTARSQAGTIESAVIGLLALLLAFTMSMAIARYDTRRQLVVDEANAIGTTYLRAKILPPIYRIEIANLLRQYVANRLEFFNVGNDNSRLQAVSQDAALRQRELWSWATAVEAQDNRSIPAGLFVQSLNDMIDLEAKRTAAFRSRVPEVVLLMIMAVAIATATVVGYNSGLGNRRNLLATITLVIVIVVTTWVIIDLDRPRGGLILVSQQTMIDLQETLNRDTP